MPRDLFRDVASRPPSRRSRHAPVVSFVAHSLAIAAAIVISIVKSETLPIPREGLAYYEVPIRVADVPLAPPPPSKPLSTAAVPTAPLVVTDAAPVVAPEGIRPESGIEYTVRQAPAGLTTGFFDGRSLDGTGLREELPPPPPPTDPVRLHSGIRAPQKVTNGAPVYPQMALRSRVDGVVVLEATIDTQGHVASAVVLRSIPLLDGAALDAVRQWKFMPALLNGVPIPVIMTVTVRFQLQ